jgi:PAS domain-containing protein
MPELLKKTSEALRASEERLQLALRAGGSGVWDWDPAREVAEVSPTYRELFGLPPDAPVTYETDGLPLIVWMHDASGAPQFVNRTFLEYFGVEEAETKGERWQRLLSDTRPRA